MSFDIHHTFDFYVVVPLEGCSYEDSLQTFPKPDEGPPFLSALVFPDPIKQTNKTNKSLASRVAEYNRISLVQLHLVYMKLIDWQSTAITLMQISEYNMHKNLVVRKIIEAYSVCKKWDSLNTSQTKHEVNDHGRQVFAENISFHWLNHFDEPDCKML